MAGDFFTDPSLIQKEVEQNLAKGFPEAYLDVVRHADLSSLTWAPLMLRTPWNIVAGPMQRGGVTVAGDAMHPMTPDLGQGGCSALEDAVVLARSIGPALSAGAGAVLRERSGRRDEEVRRREEVEGGGVGGGLVFFWLGSARVVRVGTRGLVRGVVQGSRVL
ncbi:uncharacterized protein M6B38_412040 [Iris pallida]|uniref:FAD-binding domain-containing protein n=1 Tax=Iris pallida TaxID=29817 RepID=A0AAX6FMF6_IRIPA|nr:uncharacterized protein M6B38_412040 [Iris pallida]